MKSLITALLLVLAITACGSGDDTSTGGTTADVGTGGTTATTGAGTTEAPTTTIDVSALPSIAGDLDVPTIEQLTAVAGGGSRPLLEWSPLDGADRYFVFVNAPSGDIYWAWRTRDTSVPVGGFPQLDEDAAGPAVSDGMSWVVLALDTDGNVVGISPRRPIAP